MIIIPDKLYIMIVIPYKLYKMIFVPNDKTPDILTYLIQAIEFQIYDVMSLLQLWLEAKKKAYFFWYINCVR